jgi:hypothetical protein
VSGSFRLLSGDHVVASLPVVPKGTSLGLTLDLAAGVYRMECGVGSTAGGGVLAVGAASGTPELGPAPDVTTAMVSYRHYLEHESSAFALSVSILARSVGSRDLGASRAAWVSACNLYGRVRAAAQNFSLTLTPGLPKLDAGIDPTSASSGLPLVGSDLVAGVLPPASVVETLSSDAVVLEHSVGTMDLDAIAATDGATFVIDDLISEMQEGGGTASVAAGETGGVLDAVHALIVSLRGPLEAHGASAASISHLDTELSVAEHAVAVNSASESVVRALDALADGLSSVPATLSGSQVP